MVCCPDEILLFLHPPPSPPPHTHTNSVHRARRLPPHSVSMDTVCLHRGSYQIQRPEEFPRRPVSPLRRTLVSELLFLPSRERSSVSGQAHRTTQTALPHYLERKQYYLFVSYHKSRLLESPSCAPSSKLCETSLCYSRLNMLGLYRFQEWGKSFKPDIKEKFILGAVRSYSDIALRKTSFYNPSRV